MCIRGYKFMGKLSLQDLELEDKKVLMRVDFNVPQDKGGMITDDTRIREVLPSIRYILSKGAKLILMSHLGKPKGQFNSSLSLKPIAEHLSKILHHPVMFSDDCIGDKTKKMADSLHSGEILLLENLRFHKAEEDPKSDPAFAKELSKLGDVFVDDAFGNAHRKHSSNVEVPKYFPDKSAAGFLMEKEIKFLGGALTNPKRPFFAIIGGAKVSSKLGIIKALLNKVDAIFIGGAMAYTFLKARGLKIGSSLVENDLILEAKSVLDEGKKRNIPIYLPVDHLITKDLNGNESSSIVDAADGIPDQFYGVDIGPKTMALYSNELKKAATIVWNGPLGIFEVTAFSKGTSAIANIIASLKCMSIVGGGDSIAALQKLNLADKISHVSTGGGASLEYLEYGTLPGIDVLSDKKK